MSLAIPCNHCDYPRYLAEVVSLLSAQGDLSPRNPLVNSTLSQLIGQIAHLQHCPLTKEDPLLQTLPALCAQAESQMEHHWHDRIVNSPTPHQTLKEFWYYNNYHSLVAAEVALLQNESPKRFVFLGAGSLPMSALMLAEQTGCEVVAVEADADVAQKAFTFVKALGATSVTVVASQAEGYELQPNDLPLYASLLKGNNLYQKALAANCKKILVRDSECAAQLIYTPAQTPPASYTLKHQTPYNPFLHINTTKLYINE